MTELIAAILGTLIGAILTHRLSSGNDRTRLTLEFHKEFNSLEMSKIRRQADDCIRKFPDTDFNNLRTKDEEGSISVFIILRFYQRVWQCISSNSFNNQLAADLFYESFYYWYYMSYMTNLFPLESEWIAAREMKLLFSWMTMRTSGIELSNYKQRYEKYLKQRLSETKAKL
jgi:hypothetical protein